MYNVLLLQLLTALLPSNDCNPRVLLTQSPTIYWTASPDNHSVMHNNTVVDEKLIYRNLSYLVASGTLSREENYKKENTYI
jgi:hypothetical protein